MELTALIVALVAGLALGLGLGWLLGRSEAARARLEAQLLADQLKERDEERATGEKVSGMIEGLQTRIKELQDESARVERERIKSDSDIRNQIESMANANQTLATQTAKLAGALSNASTRGKYGEMQLETLLEHSGLLPNIHYTKQTTSVDGSRPDVTIKLPGGAEIFVDSKFPFDRFWDAAGAESPEQKRQLLTQHAKDLLDHATALAKRGYHDKNTSPDFVVLFAPVESILSVALDVEPQLLNKMFEKNVVVATPTSMLALLRTIGYGYNQQDMAANAAEIRDLASDLLKRIVTVHTKLQTLGDRIKSSGKAFDDVMATAENNLLVPARKMVKLGVPSTKSLTPLEPIDLNVRQFKAIESGIDDGAFDDEIEEGK